MCSSNVHRQIFIDQGKGFSQRMTSNKTHVSVQITKQNHNNQQARGSSSRSLVPNLVRYCRWVFLLLLMPLDSSWNIGSQQHSSNGHGSGMSSLVLSTSFRRPWPPPRHSFAMSALVGLLSSFLGDSIRGMSKSLLFQIVKQILVNLVVHFLY